VSEQRFDDEAEQPGASAPPKNSNPDSLVPDPVVCREFGVTSMTLWRWTHDSELNFPPAIAIRNRNFRSRKQLEDFKERMLRKAMRQRRGIDQHQTQANDDDHQDGRDDVAK
jgi:hypothetical protein